MASHTSSTAESNGAPRIRLQTLARLTRMLVGLVVVASGMIILLGHATGFWSALDRTTALALSGGGLAAAATALGTLPVALSQRYSERAFDAMLGFGAGVMLAATAFSLVLPALAAAQGNGYSPAAASGIAGAGIIIGGMLLLAIDRLLPHEHFVKGREGREAKSLQRTWLFVFAIVLHNLPEGLAIGVAAAGPDALGARSLATGIAIQDVPEGLVVALALLGAGYSRPIAVGIGMLSGLVEPLAALLGVLLIGLSASLLPWGLAMAGGAMLYVISHEIIPESHRKGHEAAATTGLMLGFVVMMVLDTALS